jgi:hypothetical protein
MAQESRNIPRTANDILYDALFSGGLGGSIVALFFLLIDSLEGQPLFTPALMGSVLFGGAQASSFDGAPMNMIAYYTLVHFATFGALGLGISFLMHEVELHTRHPVAVMLGCFAVLELGFVLAAATLLPGVIERIGAAPVAIANLLAAGSMAGFLGFSHRPDAWQRVRHAMHLT